jgi:hypothetical protein
LALFRGYHTVSDLAKSTADQLQVLQPGLVYHCGVHPDFQEYTFQPRNDSAQICGQMDQSINGTKQIWCQNYEASVLLLVGGYWTGDGGRTPAIYHWFESGIYTVVGEDEWGRIALMHFVVSTR